jgi:hypothetical protein
LVYGKNLAGSRAACAVDQASSAFCEHGAGEKQVAANAALLAVSAPNRKLVLNIFFLKMNHQKTPDLGGGMNHDTGISEALCNRMNPTIWKGGQGSSLLEPPVYTKACQPHIRSC